MHQVQLPERLYKEAQRRAAEAGFSNVDEYVAQVVGQHLAGEVEDFDRTVGGSAPVTSPSGPQPKKQYKESTKAIVAGALEFAKQKRQEGWTRQEAAESLRRMLESDTGDEK